MNCCTAVRDQHDYVACTRHSKLQILYGNTFDGIQKQSLGSRIDCEAHSLTPLARQRAAQHLAEAK